jgi:hypothetical protein
MSTFIRTFRGKSQSDAITEAHKYAAQHHVEIVSQSWEAGHWSGASFLVALLLCFVLIGLLVFVYMLIVKPAGELTVVFRYPQPGEAVSPG